jgi:starch-binding outer membrane protein, SusD/RagB family
VHRAVAKASARLARTSCIALTLLSTACDFQVVNPGPVQDEFLNNPRAFNAVLNGMGRDLSEAMNFVAFHQAMVVRELFPTGGTGQFGISPKNADGILAADEQESPWRLGQRARWVAEDGLRRFRAALGDAAFASSPEAAQAYLWAGYSNRLLGENMCQAVIDLGPAEPREVFLRRAEEHFTKAIETALAANHSGIVRAALAGRAAVRAHLGDWSFAEADASEVPTAFIHRLPYFDFGDQEQFNRIAHAGANTPYKTHTVWGTYYASYFRTSGDPRVRWEDTRLTGDGAVDCCGRVPFYRQLKYRSESAPINLSSGREMRLIEAEASLRRGDWERAMRIINDLRAAVGVAPLPASNLTEAWTRLKRERGIELWLEGRRLGDLHRWKRDGSPGDLDPLELPGPVSHLRAQDLCFPIPTSERETNPHLKG